MSDLYKTAALSDVIDIPNAEISLFESDISTEFEDLVSLVSDSLIFLVPLLEVNRFTGGANQVP